MRILQKEAQLQEIVQLVGSDALPEKERLLLEVAKMIREGFLQQNAYHEVDTYCSLKKQYGILKAMLTYHEMAEAALDSGAQIEAITGIDSKTAVVKLRFIPEDGFEAEQARVLAGMKEDFKKLK
jgi:V/A-type H+-transporting ATPase subunit A